MTPSLLMAVLASGFIYGITPGPGVLAVFGIGAAAVLARHHVRSDQPQGIPGGGGDLYCAAVQPVSYTHLTLPTIYSV